VADEQGVVVGKPAIPGALVVGRVLSHGRSEKKMGFKYRRRKNYRRKWGQRTEFSTFQIMKIEAPPETELRIAAPVAPPAVVTRPAAKPKLARPKPKAEKRRVAAPKPRPAAGKAPGIKKPAPKKGVKSLISRFKPKGKKE
jgi:hypothetical protein